MKRNVKWLTLGISVLLLVCMLGASLADVIYVTPRFRIPSDRIVISNEIVPTAEPEVTAEPETTEQPAAAETEVPAETATPQVKKTQSNEPTPTPEVVVKETATPEQETEQPETSEQETEQPATEEPVTDQPTEETETQEAATEATPEAEAPETEASQTEGAPEGEATEEPAEAVEKKVTIFSSRKETVTNGERIYLTSLLEGFDGLQVTYQWQADRGNGWENIEGADRDAYSFIATEETILYSWRLLVFFDSPEEAGE